MRTRTCILLALALLLAPSAVQAQHADHDDTEVITPPRRVPPEAKADLATVAESIISRTNAFRKEQKRAKVEANRELTKAARNFADYMAKEDRFGHAANGSRPADRAKKHGYSYCIVLENIAYRYSAKDFESAALAEGFVQGWKDSPGHRRNMLDPDVTETAVAVARSEKTGYYYAVQLFGRPKSEAIEFRIDNRSEAEVAYQIGKTKFRLQPGYIRTHTRCRPEKVAFDLPGDKGKAVKPANGDRYVVTGSEEAAEVKKE